MSHKQLRDNVHHALLALLSDISVPKSQTKKELRQIIDDIKLILESLEEEG